MQAGRYSCSQAALGEGTPVNIWLLVHYSFAFSSTLALVLEQLGWKTAPTRTHPHPLSSPFTSAR